MRQKGALKKKKGIWGPKAKIFGTKARKYIFSLPFFWVLFIALLVSPVYSDTAAKTIFGVTAKTKPPFAKLPPKAKLDVKNTLVYKYEKLTVVRTNLKNTFRLAGRSLAGDNAEAKKLASVNSKMPVSYQLDRKYNPELMEDRAPAKDNWTIMKENVRDAAKAYVAMMLVRIVSIDNKPVLIMDNKIVPFDKTDRILRWAPLIEKAARKYNLDPALIAAVIEQESGGDPTAGSHAGAIGLMQLMPKTAKGLGVDPYNPEQNIDGGSRYLTIQLKRFGNLEQALAAYNAGPGNVFNGNYLYISETQNYIRNVPALMNKYRQLFAGKVSKPGAGTTEQ